jgi:hypothetical protein
MNSITSFQNKTKNHLKVEVHSSKIIIHVSEKQMYEKVRTIS